MNNTIIAGDSFSYTISTDYSADDGYSAFLVFRGQTTITMTATSVGGEHTFTETANNTRNWSSGKYNYVLYVVKGNDEYTVKAGQVDIQLRADLSGVADVRTYAEKVLEQIEALIAGQTLKGVESYSINGRSISKMGVDDLIKLRGHFRREVAREKGKVLKLVKWRYTR